MHQKICITMGQFLQQCCPLAPPGYRVVLLYSTGNCESSLSSYRLLSCCLQLVQKIKVFFKNTSFVNYYPILCHKINDANVIFNLVFNLVYIIYVTIFFIFIFCLTALWSVVVYCNSNADLFFKY